jgi:hypothetical protein
MDVLQKKYPSQDIRKYVDILKYKNSPIMLLGSGGLEGQNYPSDIDLFTKISSAEDAKEAFTEIMNMVNEFKDLNNVFFVEFKIQQTNGNKYKFKTLEELENDDFKFYRYFDEKIDYCKFDFVILLDGRYIELSSIYVFNQAPFDANELMKSLLDDRKEMMKEGKFYKSIKRLFAYIKLQPEETMDKDILVEITRFFNSNIGRLYQENSILKAIKLMMETYPDNAEIDKYNNYVFSNMGFKDINDIDKIINEYDNLINREGHKFIKMYLKHYSKGLVGGWKQTGSREFSSRTLPQLMGSGFFGALGNFVKGEAKGLIKSNVKGLQNAMGRGFSESQGFIRKMPVKPAIYKYIGGKKHLEGGIFDGTEGMTPWQAMKYGFALPFKAVKEVNKVIPLSMLFGGKKEEMEGGNLIGEFFNSAINPFYGMQKYRELTGGGMFDSYRKLTGLGHSNLPIERTAPWDVLNHYYENTNIDVGRRGY